MKLSLLLPLAALASLTIARADLTIILKTEEGAEGKEVTMMVKGPQVRVDVSDDVSMLLNTSSGDMTTLMHRDKKAMRISGEQSKAMAEMAKSFAKDAVGATSKPVATGRKEKINGYDTDEYVTDSPKYHASYWVAKSYPAYQRIMQQMDVLQNGAFGKMREGLPDFHDLPGLPLRTVIKTPDSKTVTSMIETISNGQVPDSQFSVPPDYTEMKVPNFLDGKKGMKAPNEPGGE